MTGKKADPLLGCVVPPVFSKVVGLQRWIAEDSFAN